MTGWKAWIGVAGMIWAALAAGAAEEERAVDLGTLLTELHDLEALARLPDPAFRTIQWSSCDRRSVSRDAEGWYSNADGFGGEPIPGFAAVLEPPGEDGTGLYLVAEVKGPGAVVRGWSAGMGGTLEVFLDGAEEPVYRGPGYDFLARRSKHFLAQAGLDLDPGDAFIQEDADYFPLPFAESLRVTWRGKVREIHFYHLVVRCYEEGTRVKRFDPKGLEGYEAALRRAVDRLRRPVHPAEKPGSLYLSGEIPPAGTFTWKAPEGQGPQAVYALSLRLLSPHIPAALRGTLLRITFDGASEPQVEAPAGDFFGSGPGLNPFESLPMAVAEDGLMTCRFVMPFRKKMELTLHNTTQDAVRVQGVVKLASRPWDDRSLYFHARWRTDRNLDLAEGPFDLPYVLIHGRGVFVGAACMVVNPSGVPHPAGSWWGEGDEKIFTDEAPFPAFFGTGSEDYYNYSWSRPDLFAHPFCGQTENTGPGNQGYCSDFRWHVIDAVPFERFFAFYMELWHHRPRPGLAYGRIAYLYARPGAVDDHRRIQRSELFVPPLPPMEPEAAGGAQGARFFLFDALGLHVQGGVLGMEKGVPCAARGVLVTWKAEAGDRIRMTFNLKQDRNPARVNLVAAHTPDGGAVRLLLDGKPLVTGSLGGAARGRVGEEKVVLRSRYARRILSTGFKPVPLSAGAHTLVIEVLEGGAFGFDYLWVR